MYNEKDWRKKKIQKRENKFYANPNYGGIIKPEEKKQMSIAQINDGIKEAERQVQTYKNEWMDSVFSNASEQQISAAKNNMEAAKGDVVKLNEQLSAAYGLGKNGYWNNQNTQADNIVNDFGQQTVTQSDVASKTAGHPKAPRTNTAAKPKTNTKYDMDIALLQDELVNNPQMSDYEKGQINDKLTALNAKRDVLNWKETHPTNPTLESYETQKSYLDKEIQYAQDDMVNAVGSGEVKVGDENWNKYTSKINELVTLKDEYNNGMMGLLDGQKAQTGGGSGIVGFDASDDAMFNIYGGKSNYRKELQSEDGGVKKIVEDAYNEILGMDYNERVEFINSGSALNYFNNLESIKKYLSDEEILAYRKALFGMEVPYEVSDDGQIVVKTSPFMNEAMQEYIAKAKEKYSDSIGGTNDPYNNMIYAIANAEQTPIF